MAAANTGITVQTLQGELVAFDGDAIVVPTNSYGLMIEGVAALVKERAGAVVEEEAARSAPIAVGAAVVTGAGALPLKKLIHVPLVEQAGVRVGIENVRRATRAGLLGASHFALARIAIPGMGYGENGIPYDETARAILDEVRAFRGSALQTVVLVDPDPAMCRAFRQIAHSR